MKRRHVKFIGGQYIYPVIFPPWIRFGGSTNWLVTVSGSIGIWDNDSFYSSYSKGSWKYPAELQGEDIESPPRKVYPVAYKIVQSDFKEYEIPIALSTLRLPDVGNAKPEIVGGGDLKLTVDDVNFFPDISYIRDEKTLNFMKGNFPYMQGQDDRGAYIDYPYIPLYDMRKGVKATANVDSSGSAPTKSVQLSDADDWDYAGDGYIKSFINMGSDSPGDVRSGSVWSTSIPDSAYIERDSAVYFGQYFPGTRVLLTDAEWNHIDTLPEEEKPILGPRTYFQDVPFAYTNDNGEEMILGGGILQIQNYNIPIRRKYEDGYDISTSKTIPGQKRVISQLPEIEINLDAGNSFKPVIGKARPQPKIQISTATVDNYKYVYVTATGGGAKTYTRYTASIVNVGETAGPSGWSTDTNYAWYPGEAGGGSYASYYYAVKENGIDKRVSGALVNSSNFEFVYYRTEDDWPSAIVTDYAVEEWSKDNVIYSVGANTLYAPKSNFASDIYGITIPANKNHCADWFEVEGDLYAAAVWDNTIVISVNSEIVWTNTLTAFLPSEQAALLNGATPFQHYRFLSDQHPTPTGALEFIFIPTDPADTTTEDEWPRVVINLRKIIPKEFDLRQNNLTLKDCPISGNILPRQDNNGALNFINDSSNRPWFNDTRQSYLYPNNKELVFDRDDTTTWINNINPQQNTFTATFGSDLDNINGWDDYIKTIFVFYQGNGASISINSYKKTAVPYLPYQESTDIGLAVFSTDNPDTARSNSVTISPNGAIIVGLAALEDYVEEDWY